MSGQVRARDWSDQAEALLAALVEALGQPQGERGRSRKAYRQASRRLAGVGVVPDALDRLLRDYAAATLRELGPMPLAAFLDGRLKVADRRTLAVQRWPTECSVCEREVRRGELAWIRRDASDRWLVTCDDCEPLDHAWERAAVARKRALACDDDPEGLLAALLEHTPAEQRDAVADDLELAVAALDA